MIGNKLIKEIYECDIDMDTKINQLLEMLKKPDAYLVQSIFEEKLNISLVSEKELTFVIIIASLIEYRFDEMNLALPEWIHDNRLRFKEPYFYNRRLRDEDKEIIFNTAPKSFKKHNVYFDIHGLKRV